ncbi:MAG TPA: ABC transporter substrate-binding protein [Gemmatimonadales bacterium]
MPLAPPSIAARAVARLPKIVPAGAPAGARSILLAGSLALLAACAAPGGGGSARRVAGDSIAIGIADDARDGAESAYRGAALAVEHLNAAGGAPIALRRPPAGARGAVAIAAALRDDPSVVGVVGHPESGTTLEAIPIYEDAERSGERALVAVSPTATSPALSGRSPWFFRVCPSDVEASRAVARFVGDSLRARRAAVIYYNDSYGRDWTKAFAATFQASGGSLVLRAPYLPDMAEWGAYAGQLRRLGADVLLFPGDAADAENAIRALRAAGVDIPFIGGDPVSALEERAAEFAGARYTAFFDPRHAGTSAARTFVDAYRARWGSVPDQRAALAYDAATLIGRAAREVRGDRRAVRDYLAGVGSTHPALEGVTGRIAFDSGHDPVNKPVVIATVGAP